MKALLAEMNLARWVILVALLASVGLGFWGWSLHGERMELVAALEIEVPKRAQNIQVLSLRHSELRKDYDREGLRGQADAETYLRRLATHKDVVLGGADIKSMPDRSPAKGVVDRKYSISSQGGRKSGRGATGFDRARIANYLWLLEQQSRRVRVTSVRLEPIDKTDPWIAASDLWSWDVEVTSRQKLVDQ